MITVLNRKLLVMTSEYDQIDKVAGKLQHSGIEYYVTQKNNRLSRDYRFGTIMNETGNKTVYELYVKKKDYPEAQYCINA